MMAGASSIFISSKIIIVNKWFSIKERAMAMAILSVSHSIGQIASFALTGLVFSDIDESSMTLAEFNEKVKTCTEKLIAAQNFPYIGFFILF